MREFNPQLWFSERCLTKTPPHFVKCPTPLTAESEFWVIKNLSGRFSVITTSDLNDFLFDNKKIVFFEDSKEAMMYELRWSGN